MNGQLQFEFIVSEENNTLTMIREFSAARQIVWNCYTKSDMLDQWFAPKPLTTKTRSMDFRVGGHWHYAMVDQNGTEYWGLTEYLEIMPIDYYTSIDAFSNAAGEINLSLPRGNWKVTFSDKDENTIVHSLVRYDSLKELDSVIQMGMEAGIRSTLEKLDVLLSAVKNEMPTP